MSREPRTRHIFVLAVHGMQHAPPATSRARSRVVRRADILGARRGRRFCGRLLRRQGRDRRRAAGEDEARPEADGGDCGGCASDGREGSDA